MNSHVAVTKVLGPNGGNGIEKAKDPPMVWLLLCKEYKLHKGNRLVDSSIFSQVGYI